MEGNRSRGQGAVRSGLLTGISTVAVSASAAVLGIILSRKFGHGVKTDGFFAAYGVYLALVLVAGSLRVIVLPRFVAAREDGPARTRGRRLVGRARRCRSLSSRRSRSRWPHGIAAALTANHDAQRPGRSAPALGRLSAVAQIYGGLVASALAALDDYHWAAFGFAVGSIAGVAADARVRRARRDRLRLGPRPERCALARDPAGGSARAQQRRAPRRPGLGPAARARRRGRAAVRPAGALRDRATASHPGSARGAPRPSRTPI